MKPRAVRGFGGATLCVSCAHHREVLSPTGSRFLLCGLSRTDARFPKYPPQPVGYCEGHRPPEPEEGATPEPGS